MSDLLLVVDTSGKNGGLALAAVAADCADGEGGTPSRQPAGCRRYTGAVEIVESVALAGGTFSAQLIAQVSALLAKHGYSKSDLAGFVVVSGPGSFTGLRVGLAAIKALAEVLRKPIAAVSLLEGVAESSGTSGRVLAALDAGRGEIYAGEYELRATEAGAAEADGHWQMLSERLLGREQLAAEAGGRRVVTPDAGVAEGLGTLGVEVGRVDYPSPHVIARLGWGKILRGGTVSAEELDANYIRRSDAEIFSKPKV